MTHKYRGSIAVLSINKSVETNEEQNVLVVDTSKGSLQTLTEGFLWVFIVINK